MSDSHDCQESLAKALNEANSAGAATLVHCGDLIGVDKLRLSINDGLSKHIVHVRGHDGGLSYSTAVGRAIFSTDDYCL